MLSANVPAYRAMDATPAELAAMLGLPVDAIAGPVMWVNCGTEQPMIPLSSVDYVNACRPDPVMMAKHSTNLSGQAKTYVFARTADGFESRYFWMTGASSIAEDPGTGSACANLGGWWLATQGDTPLSANINQARLINRPNLLKLKVERGQIQVGGRVIEIGSGILQW
jgi:PhzF family phenazine biosynthesis protein